MISNFPPLLEIDKKIKNIKSKSFVEKKCYILRNITIETIEPYIKYLLIDQKIKLRVFYENFDNILQDSQKYSDSNVVIIFWELCNIIDGFHYKTELLDDKQLELIINKTKSEIDFVLKNLMKTSLVLINTFTSLPFSHSNIRKNHLDDLAKQLNHYLDEKIPPNVRLVDIEKVIASVGVSNSLDLRYFFSSKALYTIDFYKSYAEFVKPFIMSANGKAKKALIFDCDNTLWHGVLGEDGRENIQMSDKNYEGRIFQQIQEKALELYNKGIFICLCTKNNYDDVIEVINKHKDMRLKKENFSVIKRVNKN